MSKLVGLLSSSQYSRLSELEAHSPNVASPKKFSVRNQSGLSANGAQDVEKIAANSVNFFDNKYQIGFNTFKPTLSTEGFRKADTKNISSDFTGDASFSSQPTISGSAFYTYVRHANDTIRTQYKSQLIHKYLATNATKQYAGAGNWPVTPQGLQLTYTPAP